MWWRHETNGNCDSGSSSKRVCHEGRYNTILDSGSGNNVISSQVLESLPDDAAVDFIRKPPQVLLRSANGQ